MTASILSEAGEMVSASQSFPRVFKRLLVWGKVWLSDVHSMIWLSYHAISQRTNGKMGENQGAQRKEAPALGLQGHPYSPSELRNPLPWAGSF